MVDEIRADYEQLEQVANRFVNQSQAIEGMLRSVRSRFEKLEQGDWIGLGADAFFAEMRGEVLPAVTRLIEALAEGSQVTKEIGQHMQQAEDQGSAVFRD
jgi:WXG100 family type VII secretion target